MTDPHAYRPRWWRLDPQSRVEFRWGLSPHDELEISFAEAPRRTIPPKRCISLRPFKDELYEGAWTRVYGAWQTFHLLVDRNNERGEIYGLTTIFDGVPMIDVYALEPPTIGEWYARDEDIEVAA